MKNLSKTRKENLNFYVFILVIAIFSVAIHFLSAPIYR